MVFDPVKMTWLKAPRYSTGPHSPMSVGDADEEEDPFAGLDDLKDNESVLGGNNFGGGAGGATAAELEALGELVRDRVRESSGHDLAWEVIRVGEP